MKETGYFALMQNILFFSIFILTNVKKKRIIQIAYGEVAQLARASGSYPAGRWFKSTLRYHLT